jgi:hypothetical protein
MLLILPFNGISWLMRGDTAVLPMTMISTSRVTDGIRRLDRDNSSELNDQSLEGL